jgi:hypothetical protein
MGAIPVTMPMTVTVTVTMTMLLAIASSKTSRPGCRGLTPIVSIL